MRMFTKFRLTICFAVACLLLRSLTADAQIISVDEYLENPSLVKMRLVASSSPEILSSLMKKYNAASSLEDKANCLNAINASIMQTAESKRFVSQIAKDKSVHRLILEHAKLGVWLNDVNRKKASLLKEDFLYWNRVSKIGQRFEYLLDQSDSDDGNLDLYFLFNDSSRSFSSAVGELFDRSLRKRVKHWLSIGDSSDEVAEKIEAEVEQILAAFPNEDVARKVLSQALRFEGKVSHLGDNSVRSNVVLACLNGLDSRPMSKDDFGWLKAMADPKLVDNESQALLYFMVSLNGLLRQKPSTSSDALWGSNGVHFWAENLFLDLAPQYLNTPQDSSRAAEIRFLAKQCLEFLVSADSTPEHIVRRCATVVDRLITSSVEEEIDVGLELVGIIPTDVQGKRISQLVHQKELSISPSLRAKAAVALMKVGEPVQERSSTVLEEFLDSYARLGFEEKVDVAIRLGAVDSKKSFLLLFELLSSQTEDDTGRVVELCEAISWRLDSTNLDRVEPEIAFEAISKKEIRLAGPLIFNLMGSEDVDLDWSTRESLVEYLVDHNQHGLKALHAFIVEQSNSPAAARCTAFLLERIYYRIQSNFAEVHRLHQLNPDPEAFLFFAANFGALLDDAIPLVMMEVEVDVRRNAIQDSLDYYKRILKELKTISKDDDHELREFAGQQLKEVQDFILND